MQANTITSISEQMVLTVPESSFVARKTARALPTAGGTKFSTFAGVAISSPSLFPDYIRDARRISE